MYVAHQYYAGLLDALRQNDEARIHANVALEIDPSFFYLYILSAQLYYNSGNLRESLMNVLKQLKCILISNTDTGGFPNLYQAG